MSEVFADIPSRAASMDDISVSECCQPALHQTVIKTSLGCLSHCLREEPISFKGRVGEGRRKREVWGGEGGGILSRYYPSI